MCTLGGKGLTILLVHLICEDTIGIFVCAMAIVNDNSYNENFMLMEIKNYRKFTKTVYIYIYIYIYIYYEYIKLK